MTLPASLSAKRMAPLSAAIGPSTLLPSHDQTTFQLCLASNTPGIDMVGGRTGARGAVAVAGLLPTEIANGCGGFLQLASVAL
jgi:hypothetical protein